MKLLNGLCCLQRRSLSVNDSPVAVVSTIRREASVLARCVSCVATICVRPTVYAFVSIDTCREEKGAERQLASKMYSFTRKR